MLIQDAGFFNINQGKGKPIPRDPEAGNPHIGTRITCIVELTAETGELLM